MLWRENLSNIDKFLEEAVHLFDFSIIEIKKKLFLCSQPKKIELSIGIPVAKSLMEYFWTQSRRERIIVFLFFVLFCFARFDCLFVSIPAGSAKSCSFIVDPLNANYCF